MGFKVFHVDAFSSHPFGGNPAGVCLLTEPRSYVWMQRVAEELNLPETTFLRKENEGYNLRWFTPSVEVEISGHGTLASAHVLWEHGLLEPNEQAHFTTMSGWLHATQNNGWIELDFPAEPVEDAVAPSEMVRALDAPVTYVGLNRLDYLVELDSETAVRTMKPDVDVLKHLPVRAIIVTAKSSSPEYDYVTRFFAPGIGVNEDPVTGSSHCSLGPYWSKKLGKTELLAYQASRREGVVRIRMEKERVFLGGRATTIFSGEFSDSAAMYDEFRSTQLSHT
jgi:PhzF family phenazine biosynthesis protein